jgi:hypothetical protein
LRELGPDDVQRWRIDLAAKIRAAGEKEGRSAEEIFRKLKTCGVLDLECSTTPAAASVDRLEAE